jgi:hypothetical protein
MLENSDVGLNQFLCIYIYKYIYVGKIKICLQFAVK